jgi:hypothetical protein
VAVEPEHRKRPIRVGVLAVALAWFAVLYFAIVVVWAAVKPEVACMYVSDGCQSSFVESVPYGLVLLSPVLCVAPIICGLVLLGTMRLFRSPLTAAVAAGSAAAALPVLAIVFGVDLAHLTELGMPDSERGYFAGALAGLGLRLGNHGTMAEVVRW